MLGADLCFLPSPHSSAGDTEMDDLDMDEKGPYDVVGPPKSGSTRTAARRLAEQEDPVSVLYYVCITVWLILPSDASPQQIDDLGGSYDVIGPPNARRKPAKETTETLKHPVSPPELLPFSLKTVYVRTVLLSPQTLAAVLYSISFFPRMV